MRNHPKPKYRIGQTLVGRPTFETKVHEGDLVMIEVESARYEAKYGHWIYCGTVEHTGEFGDKVEIREWDVERKFK